MTRRALIIGIDDYDNFEHLEGSVNDANKISDLLSKNDDGSPNYDCQVYTSPGAERITQKFLSRKWIELFKNFDGDILFYFSGHGYLTDIGGYIVTQEGECGDIGLKMDDLIDLANISCSKSILIILDCCHSGDVADLTAIQTSSSKRIAQLPTGLTILSASQPTELAVEIGGHGIFTELVIGALSGGAADVRGRVSAASIYAYVEQALGPWHQRPLYKTNADTLPPVRCCTPRVPDSLLRELPRLFPEPDSIYRMNPSYEKREQSAQRENVEIFDNFKILRNASLLTTEENKDLFDIALESRGVKLTPLGQFYWRLASEGRI